MQERLGYTFRNPALLTQALTHRSFVSAPPAVDSQNNERLEFLGDAVLGLVVGESIAEKFPQSSEGALSKIRAGFISRTALVQVAKRIKVGECLRLGRGEEATKGREKPSILANALEAIIGAVYLDGGLESARVVVRHLLQPEFDKLNEEGQWTSNKHDYKTRLQEWAHQQGAAPVYQVVQECGPDHEKIFMVEVLLSGRVWGRGKGRTKKAAEQQAAREAIQSADVR